MNDAKAMKAQALWCIPLFRAARPQLAAATSAASKIEKSPTAIAADVPLLALK